MSPRRRPPERRAIPPGITVRFVENVKTPGDGGLFAPRPRNKSLDSPVIEDQPGGGDNEPREWVKLENGKSHRRPPGKFIEQANQRPKAQIHQARQLRREAGCDAEQKGQRHQDAPKRNGHEVHQASQKRYLPELGGGHRK
jgi:hypothetical protein